MRNVFVITKNNDTKLYGKEEGRRLFCECVGNEVDFSKPITIIFPDNVDNISSSFAHGFFEKILNEIGIIGFKRNVILKSAAIRNIKDYILYKII